MELTKNTIAFRYESPWKTSQEALRNGALDESKFALRQLRQERGGSESASAVLEAVERHYDSRDQAFQGFMAEATRYFADHVKEEDLARFWIRIQEARRVDESLFRDRANGAALLKLALRHAGEAREERLRFLLEFQQTAASGGRMLDVGEEVVRMVSAVPGNDLDRVLMNIYRDAKTHGRLTHSANFALEQCLVERGVIRKPKFMLFPRVPCTVR